MGDSKKAAGLLYGPALYHLDHLAVVCLLMEIPLIVTEKEIEELARRYYPHLEVEYHNYIPLPEYLVKTYDIIFYCIPRDTFDEIFFFAQKLLQKKIHTIWCPHGNSDKGHTIFFMEALKKETIALLYGKKMVDFLIRKHVYEQLKAHVLTGNLRYVFYKREKEFYDRIVAKEVTGKMTKGEKILLYAPTWQDYEHSSSFFDACPLLIEKLPKEYNLIVKLHPNLLLREGIKTEEILWRYEDRPNVLFLKEFPPVYPLLDLVDIYIGDMSSIGYDFLAFNKPLFFLNQNQRDPQTDPGLYLYRCGTEIRPEEYKNIYTIIERHLPTDAADFSSPRKETYEYTFGKEKNWSVLREQIYNSYSTFADHDLDWM